MFLGDEFYQDEQCKEGILATGEGHGHAHQFTEPDVVEVKKSKKFDGVLFLDVKRKATVEHGRARGFTGKEVDHDYHNPINLTPGKYVTGIVKETDWIGKEIRRVVD